MSARVSAEGTSGLAISGDRTFKNAPGRLASLGPRRVEDVMTGRVPQEPTGRNARTRSSDPAPLVLKRFKPLRSSPAGRLEVRIVEVRGERRLDIRQYVIADTFEGFTKKGVLINGEELHALLEQMEAIEAELEGGLRAR